MPAVIDVAEYTVANTAAVMAVMVSDLKCSVMMC